MRGIWLAFMVTVSVLWACKPTGSVAPPGGSVFVIREDPGITCCGVTYFAEISGAAPVGGQFYWMALIQADTMVSYGLPQWIPEGAFTNVRLRLSTSYLDRIPAGQYRTAVFSARSIENVGVISKTITTAEAGIADIVAYADTLCYECCTGDGDTVITDSGDTIVGLPRYKAFAMQLYGNDIDILSASIDTWYGRLCAEGTDSAATQDAQQGCFVGIMEHGNQQTSLPFQVQCGWIHIRNRKYLSGAETNAIYFEVTTEQGKSSIDFYTIIQGYSSPAHGSSQQYAVYRVDDTILNGTYENAIFIPKRLSSWQNVSAPYATWQGEINGRETDMPGTIQNPCRFRNCRFKTESDPSSYSVSFDNTLSSDTLFVTPQTGNRPNEWGIGYTQYSDSFWIWDVYPAP